MSHDTTLTRHAPSASKEALSLAADHPAVVEGRMRFAQSANEHKRHQARVLVSGFNSRKIGKMVTKGSLAGMPIYTLTLDERATCERSCEMWRSCMGNRMPWSLRWPATPETFVRIRDELQVLSVVHRDGFLVRLHILGDFPSVEYVELWEKWLADFPMLRVYGYTRRVGEIGAAVASLARRKWDRFAIRSSFGALRNLPSTVVVDRGAALPDGIVCPAQTHKTAACSSCGLCWDQPSKTIIFLEH